MWRGTLLALWMAASLGGNAQTLWEPQQFTSENGLPQNSVVSLAMDDHGYLWFTTEGGLMRFDGMVFHQEALPKGTGNAQERMRQIVPTADGAFLLDNSTGDLFELRDMQVKLSWLADRNHPATRQVNGGLCSAANMRWVSARLDTLRGRHLWAGEVFRVMPVSAHEWYIAGRNCVLHYRDTTLVRTIALEQGRNELFFLNGAIYGLGPRQNLFRVDLASGALHPARMDGINIGSVERFRRIWLVDQRHGEEWAYLRDGTDLYLVRPSDDPDVLRAERMPLDLPTGCIINDVLWSDAHRVLVVGTDTKGLFVYRERNMHTRLCALADPSLNNAYYALEALNDSTTLALSTLHAVAFTPQQCAMALQQVGWVNYQNLYKLRSGQLVASRANLVVFLDRGQERIDSMAEATAERRVLCFLEHGRELLVGYDGGVGRVRQGKVQNLLQAGSVTVLRSVGEEVWCATCDGVLRFHPATGAVDTVPGIREACVRSIEVVGDRVFIGTYGEGAFLHVKGRTIPLPMDRQGFLTHVHTFMPDAHGMLWISSNRGLFRVSLKDIDAYVEDPGTRIYYAYYGRNDGIVNPEFNGGCDPAYVRMPDGRALFPTLEGLVEFDPAAIPDPVPKGRVLVERVLVDGAPVDPAGGLVLRSGQQELRVRFSLPYWGSAANVQLEYHLTGVQEHWRPIGMNERELGFSRLPAGSYVLSFRKLGAPAGEAPTQLRFEVLAPFYRQGWFLLVSLLGLILFLFAAVRLYEARLRRRNQELEQAVKERTREMEEANDRLRRSVDVKERLVSIISHDIVTPLRFIARVARSASRTKENGAERADDLRDIALSSDKLYANARNLLSWIKHQEGRIELRPRHEALNPLVEEALDMVRELAASQGDLLVNDVPLDDVLRTDRDVLLIILQNIISNAVNYTRNGEVRVHGVQTAAHYQLCICDTGPGITPKALAHIRDILAGRRGDKGTAHGDPEMQGLGYVIIGELTALLGGTVVIGDRPGGGAMITLQLPLRTEQDEPGP